MPSNPEIIQQDIQEPILSDGTENIENSGSQSSKEENTKRNPNARLTANSPKFANARRRFDRKQIDRERREAERLLNVSEKSEHELLNDNLRLQTEMRRLVEEAAIDDVTGILNRKGVLMKLNGGEGIGQGIIERTKRTGQNMFLAFFDGDKVKEVNDGPGKHFAGDAYLRSMGQTLASSFRATDTVGRWGGDEFVAVLENVTEEEAEEITERAKEAVNNVVFEWEGALPIHMSISGGLVPVNDIDNVENAIDLADEQMYNEKKMKRKREMEEDTIQQVEAELQQHE